MAILKTKFRFSSKGKVLLSTRKVDNTRLMALIFLRIKKGTSAKKQVDASCKTKFHLSTKPPCSEL